MNSIFVKARAKINLAIDVIGRREDGYHELDMVMQSVSLYDGLLIKKVYKKDYIKVVSNICWLPTDEKNLVYKAAVYMTERFNLKDGIFIELTKRIPVSAGLGGGSADCAETLIGLRSLFSLPVSDRALMEIGAKFGADVPFCILKGTARVSGIGDRLKRIAPMPYCHIVLVKPPIIVSTSDVFKRFDSLEAVPSEKSDISRLVKMIERKNLKDIAGEFRNDLEMVTENDYPVITELKEFLIKHGAVGALMSGSGATVFGVFFTRAAAKAAAAALQQAHPSVSDIIVTDVYNKRSSIKH